MKDKRLFYNVLCGVLCFASLSVLIWGLSRDARKDDAFDDGIDPVDLESIYLRQSRVEVNFSDIILSRQNETRKLIVSTQRATVSTTLTDRLIEKLDFDFLKKTQNVSYTGTGHFVVDLDGSNPPSVLQNSRAKTVTIRIGHAHLEAVDVDPNDIIIDEVRESLLARGNIKLTVADCSEIEKTIRAKLEAEFNTATNAQVADDIALRMVRELYEPIVTAVDPEYRVLVEFK